MSIALYWLLRKNNYTYTIIYKNNHSNKNKIMKKRILTEEVDFWRNLVNSIGDPTAEELWAEHGGVAAYLNKQIRLLIKDLRSDNVSLAGFNIPDSVKLGTALNSPHLNQELYSKLSQLLNWGNQLSTEEKS